MVMMIPPGALAGLLQNMPPELMNRASPAIDARSPLAAAAGAGSVAGIEGSGGKVGQIALNDATDRAQRIRDGFARASGGFQQGLAATPAPPAAAPVAPPQVTAPGSVQGAAVAMQPRGGAFPSMAPPEPEPFPMRRRRRDVSGFPSFGTGPF